MVEEALQWSAVLLNRTRARIKPLFELRRTASRYARSNNGMPTFSTPSTKKKFLQNVEGRKKFTCKRIREEKDFIVNQRVEKKKLMTRPNHPTPPPPSPQKSNGRPLRQYDFRPKLHDTKFNYHFITSIWKSHNLIAQKPKFD